MIVQTSTLQPHSLSRPDSLQVYNGLDCAVTMEVFEEIQKEHGRPKIYDFERALQAPYLDLMLRGFALDHLARASASQTLAARIARLEAQLNEMALALWGKGLNPRSPAQMKEFLYDFMKLPIVYSYKKGEKKISTDRDALEKLDDYMWARPFVQHTLRIRDLGKQKQFFDTAASADGRWRAGYNITGTETGRSSSSENAFGEADNAQNIPETLRYPFIADPGYRLGVADLEQSEARDIGFLCGALFGEWKFLDNCESGDLHTSNARLVWPELGWHNHSAQDRKVAEQVYYRDYTYRYMAKRLGHLTDYMGTAFTSARVLKVPIAMAEDFRQRYVTGPSAAYPEIPMYWQWVASQIQRGKSLVTPFGRERHFFGRPNDDSTLREAIANIPQSMTADRMSLGMWRVWKKFREVQLLANGYDSITFQYPESLDEALVARRIKALLYVPLFARSRCFAVPVELKFGWNWGPEVTARDQEQAQRAGQKVPRLNPDGLRKHSAKVPDLRRRTVRC